MIERLAVTVAVLTFRRNDELRELLPQLLEQLKGQAGTDETIDNLVVDNDPTGATRPVVAALADPRIRYPHEPKSGIAVARNRALDASSDRDAVVFIDDDERPTEHWLRRLLDSRAQFCAVAVSGPVRSKFDGSVDAWIDAEGFCGRRHRTNVATGTLIEVAATNNLLIDLREVRRLEVRFPVDVGMAGGEDNLFTSTLVRHGGGMVWCAEALVTEIVPADRATRSWMLLRSLSRGKVFARVTLRRASSRRASLVLRTTLLTGGLTRLFGGTARFVAGFLCRSLTHHARGERIAARGLGIVLGACGYSYQAYRRKDNSRVRTGAGESG